MMVWLKRAFALLAVVFLLYFGWHSRGLLAGILRDAAPLQLVFATALWLTMHLLSPLFVKLIFRGCGHDIDFLAATQVHLANLPARYIPGGVWHTVGRVAAYRALGVGARRITLFVIYENSLAVAVAFLVGGGLLYLIRGADEWGGVAGACAAAGALALIVLPAVIRRMFRESGGAILPYYLASVVIVAISWGVASLAFVQFVAAFPGLGLAADWLETAAVYLFSWGVGFLAVFAPQGVGVFEVTAGELLRGSLALGGFAVLLAGFRGVIFAADLLAWICGRLLLPGKVY
jgi:hypothetical protein